MTETVGGVKATFTGDSSGLAKAVQDAITKMDSARARAAELSAALKDTSVTSKLSADGLRLLQNQADKAEQEVRQLTAAQSAQASTAHNAVTSSVSSLGKAREGIEKMRGMMGSVGQAAGVASAQFGAFGGIVQNSLGAFMAGGGVGVGLSLFASGLMLAADHWDVFGKKAAENAAATSERIKTLTTEVNGMVDALNKASGAFNSFEVDKIDVEIGKLTEKLKGAIPKGAMENFAAYRNSPSFRNDSQVIPQYQEARSLVLEIEKLLDKRHYLENEIAGKEIAALEAKLKAANEKVANAEKALAEKVRREEKSEEDFQKWMQENSYVPRDLTAPSGELTLPPMMFPGGAMIPGTSPASPPSSAAMLDERLKLTTGINVDAPQVQTETIGDKIGKALGEKGTATLMQGFASGDMGGAFSALGGIIGAAAGIPFAGQIIEGVISIATQVVNIFMAAGQHMADMISRPFDKIFSSGGAGQLKGMFGQLQSDMGQSAKSATDMLPVAAVMGPAGISMAGPAAAMMSQQAMLSIASFGFALTTANKQFEKFSNTIGMAGTIFLDSFAPIWDGLMPIAGAFIQIAEAVSPILAVFIAFLPLEKIAEAVIIAMKWASLAIISFGKGLLTAAAGIIRVMYLIGVIDKDTRNEARAGITSMMDELKSAATAIADITVTSAQETADRAERAALRQAAIEAAKAKASDRASKSISDFSETLTNVPSGYKRRLNEIMFGAADPENPSTNGAAPALGTISGITVNIATWYSRSSMSEDLNNIKRLAKNGTLAAQAAARTFNPDDRN